MKQRIIVQVLIKHRDKYLFLGRKHFDKHEEGYLDLVGGTIIGAETLVNGLKREVKEKIHIELLDSEIRPVDFDSEVMTYKGRMTSVIFLRYFAEISEFRGRGNEREVLYWLREGELPDHQYTRATERFLKKLCLVG